MIRKSARAEDPRATYRTRYEAFDAMYGLRGWPDAHPQRIDPDHGRPYWVLCMTHNNARQAHLYSDGYVR